MQMNCERTYEAKNIKQPQTLNRQKKSGRKLNNRIIELLFFFLVYRILQNVIYESRKAICCYLSNFFPACGNFRKKALKIHSR